jgi:hypothetical protein
LVRTDLIEQLVVIEDRGSAGEDDDATTGEGAIDHMTDALRRGRDRNAALVVYLAGRFLLDMRGRQLHLDDVRPELSRDMGRIADDVDRCFAFLAQTRPARIGPYNDRQSIALRLLGIGAELPEHRELVR